MLFHALNHNETDVRIEATRCLGALRTRAATTALIQALRNPDPFVRSCAACALRKRGTQEAIIPLIELLERGLSVKQDESGFLPWKDMMDASIALEEISGEKFGPDPKKWRQWFRQQQARGSIRCRSSKRRRGAEGR